MKYEVYILFKHLALFGPWHEKTCLQGLLSDKAKTCSVTDINPLLHRLFLDHDIFYF